MNRCFSYPLLALGGLSCGSGSVPTSSTADGSEEAFVNPGCADSACRCLTDEMCGPGELCLGARRGRIYIPGACVKRVASFPRGAACTSDAQCAAGLCWKGLCRQRCMKSADCPGEYCVWDASYLGYDAVCTPGEVRCEASAPPHYGPCVAAGSMCATPACSASFCFLNECHTGCASNADCDGTRCVQAGTPSCRSDTTCGADELSLASWYPITPAAPVTHCLLFRSCQYDTDCADPYTCMTWTELQERGYFDSDAVDGVVDRGNYHVVKASGGACVRPAP